MAFLVGALGAVIIPTGSASAASFTMTVDAGGLVGRIGVDAIYQNGMVGNGYDIKTCSNSGEPTLGWDSSGNLEGTTTLRDSVSGLGSLTTIRLEMYPGPCGTYSPWNDAGGAHVQVTPSVASRGLGRVTIPRLGQVGSFRIDGDIIASTPIADGRVQVDSFQIATGYPEAPQPLQTNGIVDWGAFASGLSRGTHWTAGVGWQGRYIMFVEDTVTRAKIRTLVDIVPGAIPTIDLDAICFGFDMCLYDRGGPGITAGSFHPTSPTRILDTRLGLGIANGAVRTGDGRLDTLDPVTRRDETANHDLQVTGRYGVPSAGVSAVLLNVTAVNAPGPGYLSVVPKPQSVGDVFDDQGTYWSTPSTSNLNVDDRLAVPNLVLARVGAGGKIRVVNSFGPTDVVADIAGWFGTGGANTNGAGFVGVAPQRAMDSRVGIGGPAARFAAGESRSIQIAGKFDIPANAQSVVINITSSAPDGIGYLTAYPDGEATPIASNVNSTGRGSVRANLAVVKTGAGGRIRILAAESAGDVIIDVLGSFGPYGGTITTITPERIVDTRTGIGSIAAPLGTNDMRTVQIAGRGTIPANATGVVVNVTSARSTSDGYLTVWPTAGAMPPTSTVNFRAGRPTPNLAILKLGIDGKLDVFNERGSSDVLLDVLGYVTG